MRDSDRRFLLLLLLMPLLAVTASTDYVPVARSRGQTRTKSIRVGTRIWGCTQSIEWTDPGTPEVRRRAPNLRSVYGSIISSRTRRNEREGSAIVFNYDFGRVLDSSTVNDDRTYDYACVRYRSVRMKNGGVYHVRRMCRHTVI